MSVLWEGDLPAQLVWERKRLVLRVAGGYGISIGVVHGASHEAFYVGSDYALDATYRTEEAAREALLKAVLEGMGVQSDA